MSEKKQPESMHMKKCERMGPIVFQPDSDSKIGNIYKKVQSIVSFDGQRFVDTGERYRRLVDDEQPGDNDEVVSLYSPSDFKLMRYVKI